MTAIHFLGYAANDSQDASGSPSALDPYFPFVSMDSQWVR